MARKIRIRRTWGNSFHTGLQEHHLDRMNFSPWGNVGSFFWANFTQISHLQSKILNSSAIIFVKKQCRELTHLKYPCQMSRQTLLYVVPRPVTKREGMRCALAAKLSRGKINLPVLACPKSCRTGSAAPPSQALTCYIKNLIFVDTWEETIPFCTYVQL